MQELNELKNLVIQSLEANGSLSNIRAQIRASVFKVIDQQDNNQPTKKPSPFAWENPKCSKLLENENGILVLQLIKEFLQFYSMDYSNSVFSSESNLREEVKRDKINEKLTLGKPDQQKPLLLQLIEEYKSNLSGISSSGSQQAAPNPSAGATQQEQKKQSEGQPQKQVNQQGRTQQEQLQQQQQQQQQRQQQANYQDLLGEDDFEQSLDSQSDHKQVQNKPITSPQQDDKSVQSLESTSEKKALQEAQQFIQKSQNQMRSGQIGSLPVGQQQQLQQQQQANIQQQNKFNANLKQYDQEQFDQFEDIEGVEEQLNDYQEDLEVDDDILNSKGKNAGASNQSHFEESEDYIGQSSKGHDISVDSYALENFDYIENVEDL